MGQRHHGDDVLPVVVEDTGHGVPLPGAQILLIEIGDQRAGHIVFRAAEPQDGLLQMDQPAAFQPPPPKPPRGEEQIQVRAFSLEQGGHLWADVQEAPILQVACPQERCIEGAPIEGHGELPFGKKRGDGGQDRGLFARMAHKKLAGDEMGGRRRTAKRQPGGLAFCCLSAAHASKTPTPTINA